jgi:hypothetical protein
MVGDAVGLEESTKGIYELDEMVFGALKSCEIVKMNQFESKIKPVINGTKWVFNNEDGMEIDLKMIP